LCTPWLAVGLLDEMAANGSKLKGYGEFLKEKKFKRKSGGKKREKKDVA